MRIGKVIDKTPDGGEIRKDATGLWYYAWPAGRTVATRHASLKAARAALGYDPQRKAATNG